VTDKIEVERLLGILDGLPLAIAQAGAYLQESGVGVRTYTKFYEQQWKDLMSSEGTDLPIQDYPERNIWTTWVISYNAIREKNESAANMLLLWSFLDNKDLWYGLLATACQKSITTRSKLSNWIGNAAISELKFSQAMRLLRNYSLVEEVEAAASYYTHPVVHKWAYHYQSADSRKRIGRLAVMVVGWAVPPDSARDKSAVQRRLLPHVQACSQYVAVAELEQIEEYRDENEPGSEGENIVVYLDGVHLLGLLYADQGKLGEAEMMYMRALQGKEEALGPKHTSTLGTVNNLGNLYANQGKLDEAEKMYMRALQGYEETLDSDTFARYRPALNTLWGLGYVFAAKEEIPKARVMYTRSRNGFEALLGSSCGEYRRLTQAIASLEASKDDAKKDHLLFIRKLMSKLKK
jgi:tetratricopeptide (TPR) repeat protein